MQYHITGLLVLICSCSTYGHVLTDTEVKIEEPSKDAIIELLAKATRLDENSVFIFSVRLQAVEN